MSTRAFNLEIVWDSVCQELVSYFAKERPDATAALDLLHRTGCNREQVLRDLYLYCGGDPKFIRSLRKQLIDDKKKMLAISRLVRENSSEIKFAEERLREFDWECHFTPDVEALERYADFLRKFTDVIYRRLGSQRFSGRDQHLVYLSRLVRQKTGQAHYKEIADLVNATRLFYDPESETIDTAETIRKRVERFPGYVISLEEGT